MAHFAWRSALSESHMHSSIAIKSICHPTKLLSEVLMKCQIFKNNCCLSGPLLVTDRGISERDCNAHIIWFIVLCALQLKWMIWSLSLEKLKRVANNYYATSIHIQKLLSMGKKNVFFNSIKFWVNPFGLCEALNHLSVLCSANFFYLLIIAEVVMN